MSPLSLMISVIGDDIWGPEKKMHRAFDIKDKTSICHDMVFWGGLRLSDTIHWALYHVLP